MPAAGSMTVMRFSAMWPRTEPAGAPCVGPKTLWPSKRTSFRASVLAT